MCPPIHLPFHAFEPVDLPLDLTLIPRKRAGRGNGRSILLHTLGQADEFSNGALICSSEPVAELVDFLLGKDMRDASWLSSYARARSGLAWQNSSIYIGAVLRSNGRGFSRSTRRLVATKSSPV